MELMLDFIVIGTLGLSAFIAFYKRSICGLVFILPMLIHYLINPNMDPLSSFATSGFFSAITVLIFRCIDSDESLNYALLSVSCIVVDIIGCAMWFNYQPDYLYRSLFAVIYLISIYMMSKEHGRNTPFYSFNSGSNVSRHILHQCYTSGKKRKTT